MMRRWSWILLLLAANAALGVTDGLAPLPVGATDGKPYAATLSVGLSADGGRSWQASAALNQSVLLQGSLAPDPAHVGKKADVFVVELYAGKYSMLTATGTWLPWSGKVVELQPVQDDVVLQASQTLKIHSGSISTSGQHRLFIGYSPSGGTALIYSTSPALFEFTAATVTASGYFNDEIFDSIVMSKCTLCHVAGGAAATSRLQFIKDENLDQKNFDIFKAFYQQLGAGGYDYVLAKVSGGNGHVGGIQLPQGSSDYQKMATLLDLIDGAGKTSKPEAQALFNGVTLQSPAETLRDAALLLAGRLPTAAETAAVAAGGDTVLKQVLVMLMQGPHFHKFLKDSADDRLFLRGNEDFNLMDDCVACFPALNAEYWRLKDKADQGTAVDRGLLTLFMSQLNYSAVEAPLELIAYVVEQNKPYSEIITADYDMLTQVLNPLVGGTARFPAGAAATDFSPGRITTYYLRDTGTVLQNVSGAALPRITTPPKLVIAYPHAGVISSKSFLSRYPTTATNRNRARARWTYYHFLGVDIEALAKRTTDPVALADTNNPTMNNPACTVCHSVLDPVAGTFQDYADNGIYRITVNGTDSLDGNYKSTRLGPGLYKTGDTWYRDMRTPGFEGNKPGTGNSLQWLAQQIVKDDRFAVATVRFWWPAVVGAELLKAPEATEDANYQSRLLAYEAQQEEIAAMAGRFVQSGLSVKALLADLVMSSWYRAEKLDGSQVTALQGSARALASVSGEKLLTPEQLGRKTDALTGFNWNAQMVAATGAELSGLENDYNTFYGGIDGFALKTRARALTPMMSNVAAAHALESSCPIILGEFIRPDAERLLFGGLSPLITPLTEQAAQQTLTSISDTDFKPFTLTADLPLGTHQVIVSLQNDACDYASSATTCKADKNVVIDKLSITKPNGQQTVLNGSTASISSCAAVTSTTRLTLYSSCTATYTLTADQAGKYTVTASLAAKQQATDPAIAALNIEATTAPATAATPGAALIKQKLVDLHGKLLGQTVTATSPEVLASYDLLVQSWLARKASKATPSLLQKTLACDWSTDIGFISTLDYPGNPLLATGRYNTTPVTNWLTPQAQDPLLTKQSWTVVMAYLLSHYDYLHE